MDVEKFRKELSYLIDGIKDHSDQLSDYERIPKIELEMIINKIRKLYEKTIVFNHLYENDLFAEREIRLHEMEIVREEGKDRNNSSFENSNIKNEEEFTEDSNIIAKTSEKESIIADVQSREDSQKESETKGSEDLHSKLMEQASQSSLNEKFGKNKLYASLSSKLQMNPISDLSKAIGVNEKFLFTKELFKNNTDAFNNAVNSLNNFENYAQAEHFLSDELAFKYNWNKESGTVKKFVELVQRRYL